MHVAVIVLGDLGRSPRMQYHALSLLEAGHSVSLIGYNGAQLIPALLTDQQRLNVVRFSVPSPEILKRFLPVYLVWRILSLFSYLCYVLFIAVPRAHRSRGITEAVDCLLVQNPPAMPLLAVAHFYCLYSSLVRKKRPALVIDWHNLGFSMLSQPLISMLAKMYEQALAPKATAHLCVTTAMKDFLHSQFHIPLDRISVLYDCPPVMFQALSCKDQHELLTRFHNKLCAVCPQSWYQNLDPKQQTLLTECFLQGGNREYRPRRGRPALITSSTSWTPDEDFSVLLDAAIGLDRLIQAHESSLRVLIVVTGKGPERGYYQEKISKLNLCNVAIQTLWLEPADYPKLLACADMGVSLHTSTSGIDLPMKVLDLFGCQVPVCALNFACLPELVIDDENGRTFQTSKELEENLWYLLRPLQDHAVSLPPHSFNELARYSRTLGGRKRWHDNWIENALPILLDASGR